MAEILLWQVTRAGREGSVHVEGDSVVEGHAANNRDNSQLKVRRAPVYLGGAPPGAKHLPRPKLYRTGESLTSYRQRVQPFNILKLAGFKGCILRLEVENKKVNFEELSTDNF